MAKRTPTAGSDEQLKPEVLAPESDLNGLDAASTTADLDRLRDILFGQQSRSNAQRFAALENHITAVRRDLEQRMGANADSAATQLTDARAALEERLDELTASLDQLAVNVRQLRADTAQNDERLRQELLGLLAALDDRKAARQTLGDMLIEMGQRLQNG
jgi:chromosome segregation ATPase